jgi:hypothetical protein
MFKTSSMLRRVQFVKSILHSFLQTNMNFQALVLLALRQCLCAVKYNQRLFVHTKAINFADPTKHGFRVILHEEFLKSHLGPTLLPTLFVTAVPLKADEPSFTKVRQLYAQHSQNMTHLAYSPIPESAVRELRTGK